MKRSILLAALLSLLLVACSESETLPPLVVKSTHAQLPTSTPVAETTVLVASATVGDTTPIVAKQTEPQETAVIQTAVQPWERTDWGWVYALRAARGQHDYVRNASLAPCVRLATLVKDCVYFGWADETAEFGYDGSSTYFVTYNLVGGDQEFGLWWTVKGILFPLTYCIGQTYGDVQVAVKFLSSEGLVDFCTQDP